MKRTVRFVSFSSIHKISQLLLFAQAHFTHMEDTPEIRQKCMYVLPQCATLTFLMEFSDRLGNASVCRLWSSKSVVPARMFCTRVFAGF